MNESVPDEMRKEMWDHLRARLHETDADRARQFETAQKEVTEAYADVFAKLPERLDAAGLTKDAESVRPVLEKVRERGITALSDDEGARLFAYGLRLRDVVASLGLDTPQAFLRVTLPGAKWHSCGLGAVVFDSYEVDLSDSQDVP